MTTSPSFLKSSVGRKLLVGLTGVFLCLFLAFHLTVNLFLFRGDRGELFNTYAEFLATYPLLRPVEIILFLLFVLHGVVAMWLWIRNRSARPTSYAIRRGNEVSTLQSRTTFITGIVVLVFLIIHVNTFFVQSRFFASGHSPTMFERVQTAFSHPAYALFYEIALVFLAYHLRHGFESAFQTYGLRTGKYQRIIEAVAVVFWLCIPLGFALMPLYFYFRVH